MSVTLSINMAMTLDGKVSRPDGKWYGLCSKNDRRQMDVLRSEADALILGKNSIINDDPVINLKYIDGKNPRPVLIIRNGTIPKVRKLFLEANEKPIIFCTLKNYNNLLNELGEAADLKILGVDISPSQVLEELAKLGFKNILLEGGPKLNHAFMSEGLVNRINLTVVPYVIGENNLPTIVDGEKYFSNFDKQNWKLISCKLVESEVFMVYEKQ